MRKIVSCVLAVMGLAVAMSTHRSEATDSAPKPAPSGPGPFAAPGLSALPAATQADACEGRHGAFLSARLGGATSLDLQWRAPTMTCDGGVRPDGRGMRVTFSGKAHGHRLLFIFGINSPPRAGVAHNVATNLTVIFEGEQRVYSTHGYDRCSIDELHVQAVPAPAGNTPLLDARARGFCIAPASALGGGADLLISRFDFSGALHMDVADGRSAQHHADSGAAAEQPSTK